MEHRKIIYRLALTKLQHTIVKRFHTVLSLTRRSRQFGHFAVEMKFYLGLRNNHYLTNCAAMVWLGLFFGCYNRRTRGWLKDGLANLCTEMDYEVNSDGGSFEGSIACRLINPL